MWFSILDIILKELESGLRVSANSLKKAIESANAVILAKVKKSLESASEGSISYIMDGKLLNLKDSAGNVVYRAQSEDVTVK